MMKNFRLGIYEKAMPNTLTLAEKSEEALRAGFDFVELSIDETDEKIARLYADVNAKNFENFESICLSAHRKYPLGSENEATRERGMEIMRKAILLAHRVGIRIIQIAGYDVYYEPSTERTKALFFENLQKSVEFASADGVILAFETMETEFLNTVEKCVNYVKKINSPYLQIYPDTGNITNATTDPARDLLKGEGHVVALHLKESLPGKFREIPFGTGHVDFKNLITTAHNMGVRRYLAEFWHTGSENWREEIANANKFMDTLIKSCIIAPV